MKRAAVALAFFAVSVTVFVGLGYAAFVKMPERFCAVGYCATAAPRPGTVYPPVAHPGKHPYVCVPGGNNSCGWCPAYGQGLIPQGGTDNHGYVCYAGLWTTQYALTGARE